MQPRPHGRGNDIKCGRGAAGLRLQCNRGLTAAEISRPSRRRGRHRPASMQPRPHGRGNGATSIMGRPRQRCFNAAAASRPRKSARLLSAGQHQPASMQPRPHGRGNDTAAGYYDYMSDCFNAAAASRPRKSLLRLIIVTEPLAGLQCSRGLTAAEITDSERDYLDLLGFNAAAASRPRKFQPRRHVLMDNRQASMQPRPHGRGNLAGAAML